MATKDKDNIETEETMEMDRAKAFFDMEEYVEFTAPFPADMSKPQDLFIAVNGDNVVIRPGETVRIKRKFVEAYRNAQKQRIAARRYQQSVINGGRRPSADL